MIGIVSVYDSSGKLLFTKHNQIQEESKSILANLVSGKNQYRISKFYIEYQNSDEVSQYSFLTTDGADYYTNLESPSDFLRENIVLPVDISENSATFSIILADSTGFHGLPFDNENRSTIVGMALAAAPVESDQSSDLIYSRMNWDTPTAKLPGQNLYITWTIEF